MKYSYHHTISFGGLIRYTTDWQLSTTERAALLSLAADPATPTDANLLKDLHLCGLLARHATSWSITDLGREVVKAIEPFDATAHGWKPYVNPLSGMTWNGVLSRCCDAPAHSGSWNGKSGYMCQTCSRPCEIAF